MRRATLTMFLAYLPLAAVVALIAVETLPASVENSVQDHVAYRLLLIFGIVVSGLFSLAALIHLYRFNAEIEEAERKRWTTALLLVSIFAIPSYTRRFVVRAP